MDEPPSLLKNVSIDETVSYSVFQHSLSCLWRTGTIVSQTWWIGKCILSWCGVLQNIGYRLIYMRVYPILYTLGQTASD